jgi:hypothetical protein
VESIEVDLAENHAGCSPTLEPVHGIDKQVAISEMALSSRSAGYPPIAPRNPGLRR